MPSASRCAERTTHAGPTTAPETRATIASILVGVEMLFDGGHPLVEGPGLHVDELVSVLPVNRLVDGLELQRVGGQRYRIPPPG